MSELVSCGALGILLFVVALIHGYRTGEKDTSEAYQLVLKTAVRHIDDMPLDLQVGATTIMMYIAELLEHPSAQ